MSNISQCSKCKCILVQYARSVMHSYTICCPPVSGLSYLQVNKHGITIHHLHQPLHITETVRAKVDTCKGGTCILYVFVSIKENNPLAKARELSSRTDPLTVH